MAIYDRNNYVLLDTSKIRDYGISALNTDNKTEIQLLLNSNYRNEVFGNVDDTYIISQPVYGKSGKTVYVKGEIKIKDGSIVDLTHDFTISTNTLELTSASTYFAVGDHVSISDSNRAIQGGGTGQTRREGRSFVITDITGDVITFDGVTPVAFTVAASAKIGHTQSVMIWDGCDNWKLILTEAEINGNKLNQYDVEPVYTSVLTGENDKMGCGLVIYNSDDWEVVNASIKDNLLHGIAINYVYRGVFTTPVITGSHDKGILVRHAYDCDIDDPDISDSEFEDGITMYDTSVRCKIRRLKATNCGRSGIIDNDHNTDCEIEDCDIDTYGYAYSLMNTTTIFKGINKFKSSGVFRYGAARRQVFRAYLIKNATIDLNGAIIKGAENGLAGLHIMSCENIKIKNAEVTEVSGDYAACYASSLVPTNAYFENINAHDNLVQDFDNDENTTLIIT